MPPPDDHGRIGFRLPRSDALVWVVVVALCAVAYFWSARQPVSFLFSRQPNSYYELLTAGFRSGHLSVKLEPHPALLALPDPYDPVANAPYRVHDMTLYHGKYYLYFGVTPVLIFFWPVVAATGWYPTEPCAVAVFGVAGVGAGLALLCALRRRYYPAAPLWALALGGLCLALANPVLTLTAAANFYQVPIACAFCLNLLLVGALYLALHSPRRPLAWLAAASLLFGLTVGARPDYLLAGFALLIPCAHLIRQAGGTLGFSAAGPRSAEERRIQVPYLLAIFGPAALCGLGLGIYNWERFGSFSEFGMRYALAGENYVHLQPLNLGSLLPNGWDYLFRAGRWQRYFPFFEAPEGHPYGMLHYLPWIWFTVFAFRPAPGTALGNDGRRLTFMRVAGAGWLAHFLLLACFFYAADRYLVDCAPEGLLLGGIGVLALAARVARWPARLGWAALILTAGAFSIAVELAVFAARTPRDDLMLAVGRVANEPTSHWERARGIQYGALRLELELPTGKEGEAEPLFETGLDSDRRDWAEIRYLPGDQAQIALFHGGLGFIEGRTFAIPPNRKIVVEARAGSLLPPFSHPAFARWSREEYLAASHDCRISVDGVETLRAALACYPSSPEALHIGRVAWEAKTLSGPFSGRILASERLPLDSPAPPLPVLHDRTPVELQVLFPVGRTAGSEPLVLTGAGDHRDLLSCVYEGSGNLRFIFNHFGYGGPRSDAISYEPLKPHQLTVWMGSMAPETTDLASAKVLPLSRRIVVLMDGAAVFDEEAIFYPATPESVMIGRNPLGASPELTRFTGLVLAARSSPDLKVLPPVDRSGETGAVDLRVMFPDGMSGSTEPLVTTGLSGAGDIVYVHYLDPTHLSFGFHHWGISTLTGAPVEIDYRQPHRLEITMDSLYPASLADRPFSGRLRVLLDGTAVLEGSADCFPSAPYEIRLGANPLGGSISDSAFTGKILSVDRMQPAQLPAAALWTGFGRVALDTVFPAGLTGAAEPLVEAGVAGAADLIYVQYMDDHHVRFGLDHWGTAVTLSDPVELDYSSPHHLELSMDALQGPGTAPTRRVRVSLDGAEVWQAEAANYPSKADQIHLGLNSLGASSCRPSYTGQILTLARPRPAP